MAHNFSVQREDVQKLIDDLPDGWGFRQFYNALGDRYGDDKRDLREAAWYIANIFWTDGYNYGKNE